MESWFTCEDRYQFSWLIPTSQLPVADGIPDRLIHNAHRVELRGDSMRGNRGKPNTSQITAESRQVADNEWRK